MDWAGGRRGELGRERQVGTGRPGEPELAKTVTGGHWRGHFLFTRAPLGFLRRGCEEVWQSLRNTNNSLLKIGVTAFTVLTATVLIRVLGLESESDKL